MHGNELEKDERVIEIARVYKVDPATVAEMVETLSGAFMSMMQAVSEVANIFRFFLEENKESMTAWLAQNEETSSEWKRDLHKMDFTRPKIQHQVLDRKPKNLIKKIIH